VLGIDTPPADQTADDDVDGHAAEDAVAGQPLMEAEQLHQALITAVKKLPTLRYAEHVMNDSRPAFQY